MSATKGKKLFITVGTTEFDELIKVVDSLKFLDAVVSTGFNRLVIQQGRGNYNPVQLSGRHDFNSLAIEIYRFKPTLDDDMMSADLIISHCGAGSILEAVKHKKDLIVVVNTTLQGNHQTELADAMCEAGYCASTEPDGVIGALKKYAYNHQVVQRSDGDKNHSRNGIPITDSRHFAQALSEMYEFST